jgi:hypothetical protein
MLCDQRLRLLDANVAAADCHAGMVSILSKTRGKEPAFAEALANAELELLDLPEQPAGGTFPNL